MRASHQVATARPTLRSTLHQVHLESEKLSHTNKCNHTCMCVVEILVRRW